jgi:DNA-binding response OmpR family regulator
MIEVVLPKVLIIEDDDVIARGMASHLNAAGFDPLWVNKGESGLARLRYEKPDVCVLDLMLPGVDGWRVIETARARGSARRSWSSARAAPSTTACTRSRSERTTTS